MRGIRRRGRRRRIPIRMVMIEANGVTVTPTDQAHDTNVQADTHHLVHHRCYSSSSHRLLRVREPNVPALLSCLCKRYTTSRVGADGCVTSTRHARISVCSRPWEQDIRPCSGAVVRHAVSMRRRAASVADDTHARIDARRAYREGLRGPGDVAEPSSGGPVPLRRHRGVSRAAGCAEQGHAGVPAHNAQRPPCAVVHSRQRVHDGSLTQPSTPYSPCLAATSAVVYQLRADKYRRPVWRPPQRQNGADQRAMMASRRLSEPG